MSGRPRRRIATVVGWTAIILFSAVYAVELLPRHGRPPTLRWILQWPSLVTLLLWPILVAAYVWLALHEERHAAAEFGPAWHDYAARTARFVPALA